MTFEYPFNAEDIAHWVYHFENDNSIRYEILEDVERILDLPLYVGDTEDEVYERTERVRDFVTGLLWERWIDLDGSDLLVVDLKKVEDPLSLYDTAYGAFWAT